MYLYHSPFSSTAAMKMEKDGLKMNMLDFGRYEPALDRNGGNGTHCLS